MNGVTQMTVDDFILTDDDIENIGQECNNYIDDFNKTKFDYDEACDIASYAALTMYDFMFDKVIKAAEKTKEFNNNTNPDYGLKSDKNIENEKLTIGEAAEIFKTILENLHNGHLEQIISRLERIIDLLDKIYFYRSK